MTGDNSRLYLANGTVIYAYRSQLYAQNGKTLVCLGCSDDLEAIIDFLTYFDEYGFNCDY